LHTIGRLSAHGERNAQRALANKLRDDLTAPVHVAEREQRIRT